MDLPEAAEAEAVEAAPDDEVEDLAWLVPGCALL